MSFCRLLHSVTWLPRNCERDMSFITSALPATPSLVWIPSLLLCLHYMPSPRNVFFGISMERMQSRIRERSAGKYCHHLNSFCLWEGLVSRLPWENIACHPLHPRANDLVWQPDKICWSERYIFFWIAPRFPGRMFRSVVCIPCRAG